jgi:hypothetical protein
MPVYPTLEERKKQIFVYCLNEKHGDAVKSPLRFFFWGAVDLNAEVREVLMGGNLVQIIELGTFILSVK